MSQKFTEPLTAALANVLAYSLGLIALKVQNTPREKIGDEIDRGLILRRYLEEDGFYLVRLTSAVEQRDEAVQGRAANIFNGLILCPYCDTPRIVTGNIVETCSHCRHASQAINIQWTWG